MKSKTPIYPITFTPTVPNAIFSLPSFFFLKSTQTSALNGEIFLTMLLYLSKFNNIFIVD